MSRLEPNVTSSEQLILEGSPTVPSEGQTCGIIIDCPSGDTTPFLIEGSKDYETRTGKVTRESTESHKQGLFLSKLMPLMVSRTTTESLRSGIDSEGNEELFLDGEIVQKNSLTVYIP